MVTVRMSPEGGPYERGAFVWVDFDCTDAFSGVRSCPIATRLDTTTVGWHVVTFQSIDAVGNVGSVSVGYSVIPGVGPPAVEPPMLVWPLPEIRAI